MKTRISCLVLLFFSTFALPWWVTLIFIILAAFHWSWYYEGVLLVLVYELVYRQPESHFWLVLVSLILLPLIEELKKRLYVFR